MRQASFLRTLLVVIALSGILMPFAGCKKGGGAAGDEPATPESYVRFKANGLERTYKSQALATFTGPESNALYGGIFQGYAGEIGASAEHLGIVIFSRVPVKAGVYQDPGKALTNTGTPVPQVMINYYDAGGSGYISAGLLVQADGQMPSYLNGVVADGKVTITALTATYVKGTFSSTAYLGTDGTFSNKVAITDGEFYLRRQ